MPESCPTSWQTIFRGEEITKRWIRFQREKKTMKEFQSGNRTFYFTFHLQKKYSEQGNAEKILKFFSIPLNWTGYIKSWFIIIKDQKILDCSGVAFGIILLFVFDVLVRCGFRDHAIPIRSQQREGKFYLQRSLSMIRKLSCWSRLTARTAAHSLQLVGDGDKILMLLDAPHHEIKLSFFVFWWGSVS